MTYYVVSLGLCHCGKARTHAVHTSGSVKIGEYCKKHAEETAKRCNAQSNAQAVQRTIQTEKIP